MTDDQHPTGSSGRKRADMGPRRTDRRPARGNDRVSPRPTEPPPDHRDTTAASDLPTGTAPRATAGSVRTFTSGQVLGARYRVGAFLGSGGMGEVWHAFDLKLRVEVALKCLHGERVKNKRGLELLRREVRSAREVVSPNVCRIFDLVEVEGQELVSMEYIDGMTLFRVLQERGPLPLREAREIASQFLAGLEAIHEAGLVHRDVKPENVMVTRSGRVVLMDFGLAKPEAQGTGTIAGTPAYMAPEQLRGESLDARADVFAAGIVLAEMVSSEGIRDHPSRESLWRGVHRDPPKVPETPWRPVLLKAVSKERERRYPSAQALTRALEEAAVRVEGAEDLRPYPGLASFTEADAAYFFGREVEVEQMWRKLLRPHLLGLIGPSGAGKSSFLGAGLIPALPEGWRCVVCTPGSLPLLSLARAILPELAGDTEAIGQLLQVEDQDSVVSVVGGWRRRHDDVLLIVDQFEELFTLNPPEVQARFSKLLKRLAVEADVHVLLSMRDDFLFHCSAQEALTPVFSELTPLRPLEDAALRRALVQPALQCGYRFEDDALVDEMLQEVAAERGVLPLIAFAMAQLWEKRDRERGLLTRQAYQEIGRVAGALAKHAEATIERIGVERQPVVREIFRNLVTAQGTRAVRDTEELLSVFQDRQSAETVLRELIDARLLTTFEVEGNEETDRRQQVEIIHESLLSAWPRLVRWQTQDADGALLRDQLRQAAQLWQERGRPADLLWTGTSYREFRVWRERYPGGLTAAEETFGNAMVARAERIRRQRRLTVAAAFVALIGVAGVVGLYGYRADQARLRAEASKLLTLAELRLSEDPTEALAFTIASLEQADTEEARTFAMKALWEAPPAFELNAGSIAARSPAFSPDGKWLAAAGHAADVLVWSEDGRGPVVLPGHETSPNGSNRARWASQDSLVTGPASMVGSRVHLWSLPEGRRVRTIDFGRPSRWQVGPQRLFAQTLESGSPDQLGAGLLRAWALPDGEPELLGNVDWAKLGTEMTFFAPDGRSWLFVKDNNLYSRRLPAGTGSDRLLARLGGDIANLMLRNDPDQVVVADEFGLTHLWSFPPEGPPRGRVIPKPDTASFGMLPDPSGRWLGGYPDRQVLLWDLTAWPAARPRALRRSGSWYAAGSTFHPTGDWVVASTASFTRLTFWPLGRTYPSVVDGYENLLRPVTFSPDGKWLATSWAEQNRLRLWPLPGSGVSEVRPLVLSEETRWASSAYDPKGRYLFAVGNQGRAEIVPLDGTAPRKLQGFSDETLLYAAAVSPSGRLVATAFGYGGGDKTLRIWDLETGESRRFDLPEGPGAATGASEDQPGSTGYERGIRSAAFADESTLYTAGDGGLRRWNLGKGSHEIVTAASPGYVMLGTFSADGRTALTFERPLNRVQDCPRALLHDLTTGTSRLVTEFGECGTWNSVALDPSGTVAASGSLDGIVRVGRLAGGEPHLLVGHKGPVDEIAISPDLRWVATSGDDNTLRLWPMPDLSQPPLHALRHDELLAKLRSLTNLRVAVDPSTDTGWKVEVGPFPGWKHVPTW